LQTVKKGRPLVLIVDDDSWMRRVLKEVLCVEGFLVAEAAGMADAVRILQAVKPTAVILDLALPGKMSGLDLLWTCSRISTTRGVPVFVVSAYAELLPRDAFACAAGVLQKPVDLDQLVTALKQLVVNSSGARVFDSQADATLVHLRRRVWVDMAAFRTNAHARVGQLWPPRVTRL